MFGLQFQTIGLVEGDFFLLQGNSPIIMGRGSDVTVRLDAEDISRRHVSFTFLDGYWYVRDLLTTNGTRVNGQLISEPKPLMVDDLISIGNVVTAKVVLVSSPTDVTVISPPGRPLWSQT